MPIYALWIKHFPFPHFFVLAIKLVWVMKMSTYYQQWIIWAQNHRESLLWALLAFPQQKRTVFRLLSDGLKALEQPQIFVVANSSPVEPDIWRASAAAAANAHACASNKFGLLKYFHLLSLSQEFAARRQENVWLTGCCLGVYISGGDVQFHCPSKVLYCLGFKRNSRWLGIPSLLSATGTVLQNM